jgi:hypothetical protein
MPVANPPGDTFGGETILVPHEVTVGEGLSVKLERAPGFTAPGLLTTPFFFQCPPLEEFSTTVSFDHSEFATIEQQQFSRPMAQQLMTVSFDTLTLDEDPSWSLFGESGYADAGGLNPIQVKRQLNTLCRSGTPCKMQAIDGMGSHFRMYATLRSVRATERAGEIDTLYLSVEFVEFQHPDLVKRGGSANDREKLPLTLTVSTLPDDQSNMYGLSVLYYHSASRWRVIAKANGLSALSPSIDLRQRFQADPLHKLKIPALPPRT